LGRIEGDERGLFASNAAVLQQVGAVTTTPSNPCIPLGGCGTVSVSYTAVAAGSAMITASRPTCGPSTPCGTGTSANTNSYRVEVVVSAR